jgi:hypothetical protein
MPIRSANTIELDEGDRSVICDALGLSIEQTEETLRQLSRSIQRRGDADYSDVERDAEYGMGIQHMRSLMKRLHCGGH